MTDAPRPSGESTPPPLTLVVATSRNRCIGDGGNLPWHIPEDLKHFRRLTTGHAIIMGRLTHDSIGRPLPNRRNIVVTRNRELYIEDCEVVHSFAEAVSRARETDPEPVVVGGASLYEVALPEVTRIHLTEIDRDVDGDAFFPPLVPNEWLETSRLRGETPGVTFVTLERVQS